MTPADVLAAVAWHERELALVQAVAQPALALRHSERVAEIADRGGFQRLLDEQQRRSRKAEKAVVRELHRLLSGRGG
jgi:hypothetical protein